MSSAVAMCIFGAVVALLIGGAVIGRSRSRSGSGVQVASARYVTGAAPRPPANNPRSAPPPRRLPPVQTYAPRGPAGMTGLAVWPVGVPSGPQMIATGTYASPTHRYMLGATGPHGRSDEIGELLSAMRADIDTLKKGRG